jgi:Fe-S cluster biosynthesis and repair protein YggX
MGIDVETSMDTITCRRCQDERPALPRPPFRNERGERIQAEICQICWGEWLEHQTLLINHYGLDPRDPKSRAFLYEQIDKVLLGDEEAEQVDTSQEGNIEW